jgi:hypothetical protein
MGWYICKLLMIKEKKKIIKNYFRNAEKILLARFTPWILLFFCVIRSWNSFYSFYISIWGLSYYFKNGIDLSLKSILYPYLRTGEIQENKQVENILDPNK